MAERPDKQRRKEMLQHWKAKQRAATGRDLCRVTSRGDLNTKSYAVLALTLAPEFFPEGDDICKFAGTHLAHELGEHLEKNGHKIPSWVRGGCQEDWGVYFESERQDVRYQYMIMFFPRGDVHGMAIQYDIRVGWFRRLFRGQPSIPMDDPIHEVLREFGTQYKDSELLTRPRFDALY
jgi:hypothetical protein